jgi:hypothetical protein
MLINTLAYAKVIFEKAYPKSWQKVLSCHYRIERP